jgi:hypothetical protein
LKFDFDLSCGLWFVRLLCALRVSAVKYADYSLLGLPKMTEEEARQRALDIADPLRGLML